ncbi:hypothetical protein FD04_GL002299 [Secundilactobacillus odoratitofui DSM 19909 = JCM 15043]|uniref:Uncharacterized protein n=1 Tax=Secundilactobacillus odoratitofui DSM 19909 = JCM 15043 TaxID=1423776 RepID=A0A0R1M3B9_9LACO|nr:hypothetical protein [Secundilactobacillus odoratitofui]KRK99481.1 hypothetical protein FD04_GL002299 [Secundilactobacillus odoratitofui DSM 19909 = JCM 15043]
MNVINFSGHPVVQTGLVNQLIQSSERIDAETIKHFRSMVQSYDELFGVQLDNHHSSRP